MGRVFAFILMVFFLQSLISQAQTRQTLGLVLSGGGAKGLAHIGVLKAFEQEEIPIDYICGTSMGAIIGGLYASGYNLEEIEKIFLSKDFDNLLFYNKDNNTHPLYYSPRQDASMIKIKLGENLKPIMPMGLVNPVRLDYEFLNFFADANKVCEGDYDKLMIPFFCVATNVNDKEATIMRKGDLGKSIRASMTFPLFFAPIEIDGKMMCDGGIYNNFPYKELEEFYAPGVIVGSKVVNNYDKPNDEDIILYIENLIAYDTKYDIPENKGILIETPMTDIDIMDFSKKQECINRGYISAKKQIQKLRETFKVRQSKEELRKKRETFNSHKDKIIVGNIIIKGVDDKEQKFFKRLLTQNLHSDTLNLDNLKDNYISLCSYNSVQYVAPTLYYDYFINQYVLELNIKTKKTFGVGVGGMISTEPISNVFLGLNYFSIGKNAWQHTTNFYFGRYYRSFMYNVRWHLPNTNFPMLVEGVVSSNRWNFYRNINPFFEYSTTNYMIQHENNAQIKMHIPLSKKDKVVFKVGYGFIDDDYFVKDYILSTDTSDNTTFRHILLGVKKEYNSLDNNSWPTNGVYSKINVQYIHGKERFTAGNENNDYDKKYKHNHSWVQINIENKFFTAFTDKYSVGFDTKIFYSFQKLFYTKKSTLLNAGVYAPTLESFTSFFPEYRATQYIAGGMEQVYKIGKFFTSSFSVRLGAFAFVPIRQILENNQGQPYYGEFFQTFYPMFSLSGVLSTKIGSLALSLSYHKRENNNLNPWNISLNFGTIIFNETNIDK